MKNYLRITVVAIAMLGLTSASAAKKVEVSVNGTSSLVNIALKSVSVGERLVIKDFEGAALYKKTFKEVTDFQKSFSLKTVAKGVYFVEIEDGNQIQITPVLKNDLGVTLIEKAAKFIFKPQYKRDGDLLKLSVMNADQGTVKVKIYSEDGLELSNEDINDLVVKRTYNTEALPTGRYNLITKVGKKTFYKEFSVY